MTPKQIRRAFGRRLADDFSTMPSDLCRLGRFAHCALVTLETWPPHVINTMRDRGSKALAGLFGDITTFAEAYETWKANATN